MRANLTSLKTQANINHLTSDSRQVQVGSLFVAYKGDATDGRAYIPQAIANGASAVMWEQEDFAWKADWKLPNQSVAGLKQAIGELASEFYGKPSEQLWMVGVTGTNGKQLVVIGWRKPLQRLVVNLPWLAHWAMAC